MNILIIGFGNMGCRHAQSFLNDSKYKVFVAEPSDDTYFNNLERIGGTADTLHRVDVNKLQEDFYDFAVIATSAEFRFELFKLVSNAGINYILLEKVVFQSYQQFIEAIAIANQLELKVYCNFLNRYSSSYQKIKDTISAVSKINFTVTGGRFGLACNGLHYIDLFAFLTGANVNLVKSNLVKSDLPNVRGSRYAEVFGQQIWETAKGDRLFISSDKENESGKGSENHISYDGATHIINENTLTQFNISAGGDLEIERFDMPMASRLTKTLYEDIVSGKIKLPSLIETSDYHYQFFDAINNELGLIKSDLCPIT